MQLSEETWQKIPGTEHSWVYPFLRKPSITGSNSYIIRSGRYLLVIDPGAIPDQIHKIQEILSGEISGPDHPVLIIAGHIHVDHIHGITNRKLRSVARILIAAEDWGAQQLEAGSEYWTSSDIVEIMMPPVRVDLHLLTPDDKRLNKPRTVYLPGLDEVVLTPIQHMVRGSPFSGQYLPLSGGDRIEFWHTPGHSPDSLTIRIGDLIHIGDIPFSANPGIAGRPGWNRGDLLRSVVAIRQMVLECCAVTCCPGHGRTLNRNDTVKMLDRLEEQIAQLPEINLFNKKQINIALWHGLDLIEEAMKIFPVIAGRMMVLSYQLEDLGMSEESEWISTLFDDEKIDRLLSEFTLFYQEYKDGNKVRHEVISKIIRIFEQITGHFPAQKLNGIIDTSLIRRASRLFSDLLCTIYGSIPSGNPESTMVLPLIQHFIQVRTSSGVSDAFLMQIVDDEELYRQALMSRIAHHHHAKRLAYRLEIPDTFAPETMVRVDSLRFVDFLSGLSDFFEGISAEQVLISIRDMGESLAIQITPEGGTIIGDRQIPGATQREIQYAGGRLVSLMQPGQEDIRFTLPKCSAIEPQSSETQSISPDSSQENN